MGAKQSRVIIVGSGFAGLGAAYELREAGCEVTVLERASDVGGVWRDNTYPGAACDVESAIYSFSFAPNPNWSSQFAKQAEIHEYLRNVARDTGLMPHIRLNSTVERADWDNDRAVWTVRAGTDTYEGEHLILATGALADPKMPNLPGIDKFTGEAFHSARWNHDVDLTGKRVAVIGTGASAIQFVPAIQPQVGHVTVFQRTAPWVMPKHDHPITEREQDRFAKRPFTQKFARTRIYLQRELLVTAFRYPVLMKAAERASKKHLASQVSDPALRATLTPDYRLGCKRILLSNDYWASLDNPNVSVINGGVKQVTKTGVIDAAGVQHDVDVIIYGTGFDTSRLPLTDRVHGPSGTTLSEHWGDSQQAFLGTSVAGFPNLFLMHGPNIGLGHNSVIPMFEAQVNYVRKAISHADKANAATIEPTAVAQAAFVSKVDRLTDGSVWTSGGCDSWYLDSTGRNSNLWPGTTISFRNATSRFDASKHTLGTVEAAKVAAS
ncbi:flavin-containing monooxygenase [Nocardioides jejuensis]|uniref:flavin-containing monooxygenase n=1 Tax=Nocardioides jejuensis TaxID=2502782 RepID=UPI001FB1B8B9|nr:NAD(P)/FAD-dependent oxidoreductase [Nocardioides jejuensis]